MASYTLKAPVQLTMSGSKSSTFYSGSIKNEGSRTPSNFKGKYKVGILPSVSSSVFLTKQSFKKEPPTPIITHELNHDLIPKLTQSNFSSPKLAPIRSRQGRNTQSVDFTNTRTRFLRTDSKEDDAKEYLSRIHQRSGREDLVYQDEKPTNVVGAEAVNNFYSHYKHLDKIVDQNAFRDIKDSLYTSFLRRGEDLHLLPSKIGLIKSQGEKAQIVINHFKIGDKYAEILGEGLKSAPDISTYKLANNRLSAKGADFILSRISTDVEIIDLANNQIGRIGCEHLLKALKTKDSRLMTLNLEGNKLGDTCIMLLCDGLAVNRSLRTLNLSRNYLSNFCTEKLGNFIEQNSSLKQLFLYWNQIQGQGGNNILRGLSKNNSLKIVDLAWNSLGQHVSGFSKNISELIAATSELVILDLSNNQFGKEDSKNIAEGLSKNHTIYDFMFQGNYGYVDSYGFLVIPDFFQNDITTQHISKHIAGKYPNLDLVRRYDGIYGEVMDGCWLSEGWTEVTFRWTPGESGDANEDPIYLHLVHQGGQAIWLQKALDFEITLMCPPSSIEYFFTVRGEPMVAQDQPQHAAKYPYFNIEIDGVKSTVKMPVVNCITNTLTVKVLDQNLEAICPLKPRMKPEVFVPAEIIKEKIPWSFPISLFKEYKPDNEELLKKCFETDFETTRIAKIVKKPEEFEKVKEMLRACYKNLKATYKYLSAVGISGEVWSIGSNVFTDFLTKCKVIDDVLRLKDADLKFIATLTDPNMTKNPRNPEKSLIRYQFLEIWVRLAEQKFITSGNITSYAEAVEKMLNEHVLPYIAQNDSIYNAQKWRETRYWNEACDTVYKSYLPVVQSFFKKYSGMKTKPGQKKFSCLEELNKLSSDANLLNDNLVERDIVVFFNLSMMTQVDELNSDRIFQMNFVEFLDALARIAETYSALSPGEDEGSVSLDERKKRHLSLKLEGLIHVLYHRVAENIIKDTYILPEKSIFLQTEADIAPLKKKVGKKRFIYKVDPVQFYYEQLAGGRRADD